MRFSPSSLPSDVSQLSGWHPRVIIAQLMGYLGVSVVALCLDFGLFTFMLLLGAHYLQATATGFAGGLVLSYVLCLRFVWPGQRGGHRARFLRFASVGISGLLLTIALMFIAVDWLAIPAMLARLGVTVVVFKWNFLLRKVWVFA